MKQMMKRSLQSRLTEEVGVGGNTMPAFGPTDWRTTSQPARAPRAAAGETTRETAVDEDIYFRDKRNSVGLKSADECHFTSCARSKRRRRSD